MDEGIASRTSTATWRRTSGARCALPIVVAMEASPIHRCTIATAAGLPVRSPMTRHDAPP